MQETPWKARPPEGESLQELAARYRAALDDAVRRYPGKTIFIGAHSKGNMALLCKCAEIQKRSVEAGADEFHFPYGKAI
jgi:broad specificity phosphatase PhoE